MNINKSILFFPLNDLDAFGHVKVFVLKGKNVPFFAQTVHFPMSAPSFYFYVDYPLLSLGKFVFLE